MEIKLERYQKVVDDRIDFYAINEMNTSEDAKRLLLFIEQKYGELEKIHCIRVEDGKITFDKIYPSLQACFAEVGNLLDLTLITLSCKKQYVTFNMNVPNRELKVTDLRHTYGDKVANEASFKYYRDEDGDIIRYDEVTGLYYLLNKKDNMWYEDADMVRRMIDSQYSFTEIDYNPDEGKGFTK